MSLPRSHDDYDAIIWMLILIRRRKLEGQKGFYDEPQASSVKTTVRETRGHPAYAARNRHTNVAGQEKGTALDTLVWGLPERQPCEEPSAKPFKVPRVNIGRHSSLQ